jgi:hypothetical protein
VFEHNSGARVHVMGLLVLPSGRVVNGGTWPTSKDLGLFIRVNGGNRLRGTLAWARWMVDETAVTKT